MISNSERRTLSTTLYRPHSQILFLVLLFVFLGTATCTGLFARRRSAEMTQECFVEVTSTINNIQKLICKRRP